MKRNNEGLRYPSIDKLLDKIDSKYKLAYAASKVAHIIEQEEIEVPGSSNQTSVGKALEEILNGNVEITFE